MLGATLGMILYTAPATASPELATPPPSRTASWEIGLGVRDSVHEEGRIEGVRGTLRRVARGWALEAGVYGTPRASTAPALGETLVQIAELSSSLPFQYPFVSDRVALDLRFDLGALPADTSLTWAGGPHLYLGIEGRWMTRSALVPSESQGVQTTGSESILVGGPLAGVGMVRPHRFRLGTIGGLPR